MSPTTNRIVFDLLGMAVSKVLSVLPIDYWAVFGGGYVAKYVVAPPVITLSAVLWFLKQPEDRRAALVETFDRAITWLPRIPRVAIAGMLGIVLIFYFPVAWNLRPTPIQAGRGLVPPAMVSRPEFVFYLPIPDQLPPPQTVERKLPPKKRLLDSKLFPMESVLAQLPIAPRVEYPQAKDDVPEPFAVPRAPVNLRLTTGVADAPPM